MHHVACSLTAPYGNAYCHAVLRGTVLKAGSVMHAGEVDAALIGTMH